MKLFMLVPEINENHTALAHLPTWIRKIAEKVDELVVFTLNFDQNTIFPNNVKIICPASENKISFFLKINYYIFKNTIKSDGIFCLMYPILTIWASPYAKIFRKPIITWYAHAAIPKKLKLVHFLTNIIVTSSEDGCRIKSKKIRIIGQAIDTNKFTPVSTNDKEIKKILYLGRISPIKGIENLIKAADVLINKKKIQNIKFSIVGDIPFESEKDYLQSLNELITKNQLDNYFEFIGSVSYSNIEKYYQDCDLFVNPSLAGSLEKTVLEAMSSGKIVITSNEAYYNIFNDDIKKSCYFEPENYKQLEEKIEKNIFSPEPYLNSKLRDIVKFNHSLDSWANQIIDIFRDL